MLEIRKTYVIDENQKTVAVQIPVGDFQQIESALENLQADNDTITEIDVEKDIVVRMPPLSSRQVQLRVKHLGRGKPQLADVDTYFYGCRE